MTSPHKFTRNTEHFFGKLIKRIAAINSQKTTPDDYLNTLSSLHRGRMVCHQPDCFNLSVSASLLNRGLVFLDTLAKELEVQGFKIRYLENEKKSRSVVAVKDNEFISFQLSEGYKYQPTNKNSKDLNKLQSILYPDKEPVPTNKLTFTINDYAPAISRRWADGKTLIETKLPEIVNEFIQLIAIQKQQAIEMALREQKRREQTINFQAFESKRLHEKSLFEEALAEAQVYQDFQKLEEYLTAMEHKCIINGGKLTDTARHWFSTIRKIADNQNPGNRRFKFLIEGN